MSVFPSASICRISCSSSFVSDGSWETTARIRDRKRSLFGTATAGFSPPKSLLRLEQDGRGFHARPIAYPERSRGHPQAPLRGSHLPRSLRALETGQPLPRTTTTLCSSGSVYTPAPRSASPACRRELARKRLGKRGSRRPPGWQVLPGIKILACLIYSVTKGGEHVLELLICSTCIRGTRDWSPIFNILAYGFEAPSLDRGDCQLAKSRLTWVKGRLFRGGQTG